jgi:hypothetical protein
VAGRSAAGLADLAGGYLGVRVPGQGREGRLLQGREVLPVGADDGRLPRGDHLADESGHVGPGVLRCRLRWQVVHGERGFVLHLLAGELRQRAEGVRAADGGRADQPRAGGEAGEHVGQGLGVGAARVVQRADGVGALPAALGHGLGMAQQDQRDGGRWPGGEVGQHAVIADVADPLLHLGGGHPGDLIDLGVRYRVLVNGFHPGGPVVHALGTAAHLVADGDEAAAEGQARPALLEHLSDGRDRQRLVRLDLALGQRPVVVLLAVDQQDLRLAVRAWPPGDRAGRPDQPRSRLVVRHRESVLGSCP